MDRRKFLALSAVAFAGLSIAPALRPAFGATKLEEEIQKRLGVQLLQIKESPTSIIRTNFMLGILILS